MCHIPLAFNEAFKPLLDNLMHMLTLKKLKKDLSRGHTSIWHSLGAPPYKNPACWHLFYRKN